jgi:hypothetical protein
LTDHSTKTFSVSLAEPTGGAVLGAISSASVTILENDPIPRVTIVAAGDDEAVEGGAAGKAYVLRTGDMAAKLTVLYKVVGSAKSGVDYEPVTGRVTIPAGAAKARIEIKAIHNKSLDRTSVAKIRLKPSTNSSYDLGSSRVANITVIDHN